MSLPSKSLRPLAPSIRYNIRSLATARPVIPDFDDEPGLPELEIPSPNVYPNNGSNVLEVKSNLPYHTLAHTLAIARAVEAKCGRVINIDQYRSPDIQRAANNCTLTVLNPVLFEKDLILEIPQPDLSLSFRPSHYGPSLDTIQSVLSSSSSSITSRSRAKKSSKVDDVVSSTFTASVSLGSPLSRKNYLQYSRTSRPRGRTGASESDLSVRWAKEDDAIRRVLGNGFKGFYGGFEQLSKPYEKIERKRREQEMLRAAEDEEEAAREQAEQRVSKPESVSQLDTVEGGRPAASTSSSQPSSPSSIDSPPSSAASAPTVGTSESPEVAPARPTPTSEAPKASKQDRLTRLILERQDDPNFNKDSRSVKAALRGNQEDAYLAFQEKKEERARRIAMRKQEALEKKRREEAKTAMDQIKNWFGF